MTRSRPAGARLGWLFAVIAGVVVLLVGIAGTLLYARAQLDPPSPSNGHPVSITVRAGESAEAVADDLANHGLIKSRFWFGILAGFRGLSGKLRAGNYVFDTGMGASAVIAGLEAPPPRPTHELVLTEGMTAADMSLSVAALGVGVSAPQYLAQVATGTFSQPFLAGRPAGASLEGFLFPDTYAVPDGASAHDIVAMQLSAYAAKAAPLLTGNPHQAYDTLIIASMVEREAKFDDDRGKVASVIANRLAAGMRLEIDATVLYGLRVEGRGPTPEELQIDTPYNSYLHAGLPPTPIANPGARSLAAAAHPYHTAYVFYVSDGCGHNHYSVTAAEHETQVAMYVGQPCTS